MEASSSTDQKIISHLHTNWLIGIDSSQVTVNFHQKVDELTRLIQSESQVRNDANARPTVLIAESDPVQFLASFFAATILECPVFLANPSWQGSEWQQVWSVVQPDCIMGTLSPELMPPVSSKSTKAESSRHSAQYPKRGWIMIPTGGSSGRIRFVIHTWQTLMASVEGFRQFFQVSQVNACCVLPLYHVSGLMQVLRCVASGGQLAIAPFKHFEQSPNLTFDPTNFFVSLVPTQLQRLMRSPVHCNHLTQFRAVLLGGAPPWAELLDTARSHHIPLAPTYGMTETASQVATLKPDQFLRGQPGVGHWLPHAKISIHPDKGDGDVRGVRDTQVGAIAIQCQSLALGYYPDQFFESDVYFPDDVGFLEDEGFLHIVGRNSDKIISGGENIFPAEVEEALRATALVTDVAVVGMGDRHWGEVVTALYVPAHADVTPDQLEAALKPRLSRYKHPKRWIAVERLPRNAQGKVNRVVLQEMAIAHWQRNANLSC